MPTREIMQALGQEILVSYDARAKGVAEIKSSVRSELAGLDRAHRVMSTRLRADLARGAADRRRTVGAQLAALDRAHKAMGGKLRSDLAKGVSDRKAMVDSQLAGLSGARKAMGAELRTGAWMMRGTSTASNWSYMRFMWMSRARCSAGNATR